MQIYIHIGENKIDNTLNLIAPIHMALESEGYKKLTPIQEQAIPVLLEGKDLLGVAQTGTGKTASFALPILQDIATNKNTSRKDRKIQSLIIAPTRELANQIGDSFKKYGKNLNLRTLTIYGGMSQRPQTQRLRQGVDILVATPGRLLDLIQQKHVHLDHVRHFVLDEADLMLDMGMIDDVKKIVKFMPKERQNMMFSATMPKEIEKLTKMLLNNPVKVEVTPVSSTVDTIKQNVYMVDQSNKTNLLLHLLKDASIESVLVFSRTKRGADQLVKALRNNDHKAEAIHADKSQRNRERALKNFKQRKTRILVATDIAARGIDISALSHVVNYNLPEVPETYVHRIGRTGRSGNSGIALSFVSAQERGMLRGVEQLIGKNLPVVTDHPYPAKEQASDKKSNNRRRRGKKPSSGGRRNNRNKSNADSSSQPNKNSKRRSSSKNKGNSDFKRGGRRKQGGGSRKRNDSTK